MKFQADNMFVSGNFFNFAKRSALDRRQRGALQSFCPSENLENSREKAKRLDVDPPVYSYTKLPAVQMKSASIYGCELKFHSFFSGISRTF